MTQMTDTELVAQIRRELNPRADVDEASAPYAAAAMAKDTAEAKRHGCTVEELRAARRFEMAIEEYVAYSGVTTVADAARVETEGEARREARAEAQRQRRVAEELKCQ